MNPALRLGAWPNTGVPGYDKAEAKRGRRSEEAPDESGDTIRRYDAAKRGWPGDGTPDESGDTTGER